MKLPEYLANYLKQDHIQHQLEITEDVEKVISEGIDAFNKIAVNVICQCKTVVEVITVDGQYQYIYEGTCPTCKTMWQLKDIISECDEEIEIGEHGFEVEDEL